MSEITREIIVVIVLTLLNGLFVLSELALISVRKTRVAALVQNGDRRARIIQQLHQDPEALFATTQVGVSVITILASVFAGASIADHITPVLEKIPNAFVANNAATLSLILVVAAVSYLSLIIGELVPKSLGLRYAERLSLVVAAPIWYLSRALGWLISFLTFSSNIILRLFRDSTNFAEGRLSEEEIRALIAEGRQAGSVEAHEHHLIENVFDFSDLNVEKIMVPRAKMVALDINNPAGQTIEQAVESGYSRIPIFQDDLNNIVGVLYTKKLLEMFGQNPAELDLKNFLVPPHFVPSSMKISNVLHLLQRKKSHLALVTDEHGEVAGLVTLEDILEEIVGEITDETDEASQPIRRAGRDFIVAGDLPIVDFNKYFRQALPEDEDYNTVSGFILDKLGHFPNAGETVAMGSAHFVVKEAADRTVKTVLIQGIKKN